MIINLPLVSSKAIGFLLPRCFAKFKWLEQLQFVKVCSLAVHIFTTFGVLFNILSIGFTSRIIVFTASAVDYG